MLGRYRTSRRMGYWFRKRLILSLFTTKSVAGILLAANFVIAPQLSPQITTANQVNNYAQTIQEPNQDNTSSKTRSATLPVCGDGKQESRACISALIKAYAKEYGVSSQLALAIAECESNLRGNVFGDSGKAYGTYQFHKPTFKEFSKRMGEQLDYYNTEDNIKLAMWALSNKKEYHWSCYDKVTN